MPNHIFGNFTAIQPRNFVINFPGQKNSCSLWVDISKFLWTLLFGAIESDGLVPGHTKSKVFYIAGQLGYSMMLYQ